MNGTSKTKVLAVVLVGSILFASPAFTQEEQEANYRLAQLSPDSPPVDVYVNDEPVEELTEIPYQTVSSYLPLSTGTQNIKVYQAGDDTKPLAETDLDVRAGSTYTVGTVGLVADGSVKTQIYEDDDTVPAGGTAKLRAVHAAPDVAAVDISPEDGADLFVDLGFPNATRYAQIPAGDYTLMAKLTGSGKDAFVVPEAPLTGGTVYTAFAVGQAEQGDIDVILAGDAGTSGGQRAVVPATPLPGTGGPSPVSLVTAGIVLSSLVGVLVVYLTRGRVGVGR